MENSFYGETFTAEDQLWWFLALHELIEDSIRRFAPHQALLSKNLKILDAGCGTGKLIERLSAYGEVDGFDYSEEALKFCRQRGLSNITQQDLNQWHANEASYDVITSIDVLYHRKICNDKAVLKEFFKALKPGGILILNLPAFKCLRRHHDEVGFAARRYRRRDIVGPLKKIGFAIELSSYRLSYLFLPALFKALLEKVIPKSWRTTELEGIPPAPLNQLLLNMNRVENTLMRYISFPFGVSLFVVARKPKEERYE